MHQNSNTVKCSKRTYYILMLPVVETESIICARGCEAPRQLVCKIKIGKMTTCQMATVANYFGSGGRGCTAFLDVLKNIRDVSVISGTA
jgi:hypothetical protein